MYKRSIHGDNASNPIEPPDGCAERNFTFVYIYIRMCARYDAIEDTSTSGPSFSPLTQRSPLTVLCTKADRDRDSQKDKEKHRQTQTEAEIKTETKTDRDEERHKDRQRQTEIETEMETDIETKTHRDGDGDKDQD